MLKFLTSISFLYLFTIVILLVYGWLYYRSFAGTGYQRRRFPLVFALITAACLGFLYINIQAPLSLKTFSNLDHHFIRHDGFRVSGSIELGRTDTLHYPGNSYNHFILQKKEGQLKLNAAYTEEPFFESNGDEFKLVSTHFPVRDHALSFNTDSLAVKVSATGDSAFTLQINKELITSQRSVRSGISCWNLFKDEFTFINSSFYTNEKLVNSLKQLLLVRDNEKGKYELHYFIPGRLFQTARSVFHDSKQVLPADLAFTAPLTDNCTIGWGIGFPDNNKNQFRVQYLGADSFALLNRYPVSYPMTEEDRSDWTPHAVNKFLVSDPGDLVKMPTVFSEGFLFPAFNGDSTIAFAPVLLTYRKASSNEPLGLQARFMEGNPRTISPGKNELVLPARHADFGWVFTVQNTFVWKLGNYQTGASTWKWLIAGTLLFFFVLVFTASWLKRADQLSWIWQLLACVTMVLLTTRFFLYWRYKSFPPYEGLDLPSLQQLNSPWNFGIIVLAGTILALIFGWGTIKFLYRLIKKGSARLLGKSINIPPGSDALTTEERITARVEGSGWVKKTGAKFFFFLCWIFVLGAAAAFALWKNFEPSASRHLSIALMLAYFVFIYISYKYSPLVAAAGKSWWSIRTSRVLDIVISNPVKMLLSLSLLAVFVFIDIGFAIIFLNFLFFNEAFLCINFAIAGLSAGSRRNARIFGWLGGIYLLAFMLNLVYAPLIFNFLLELPQLFYLVGYLLVAFFIAYLITRLLTNQSRPRKILTGFTSMLLLFLVAFFFFPKQKILDKAAMTRYRIDVMTMPVEEAIEQAYDDGKTYEPVIRAAQNQWFINTFIYDKNNPLVNSAGFNLLPQAPQNKGARYNAQATDLVASRFLIAEHGKWSVLFYVLLLLVPTALLASFYKLYPDFTNRINHHYPRITAGFSVLNYFLVTALLVILAATGRYIFFGQDLPFGSILSKQSILFPSLLIVAIVGFFKNIPLERYPNRKKWIPGFLVFAGLAMMLFLVKPLYNKDREFSVTDLARDADPYIQLRLQPILDYFDTARATRKLSLARKDALFTDSVRSLVINGLVSDAGSFFSKEIEAYTRSGFSRHLDQRRLLYLDLYSGRPQLAINDNYFRIEPPPHLQQAWSGNVFGDTTAYNLTLWNAADGSLHTERVDSYSPTSPVLLDKDLQLVPRESKGSSTGWLLVNTSGGEIRYKRLGKYITWTAGDTIVLTNPARLVFSSKASGEKMLMVQPDAFMKNYYVNGNRFYSYPLADRFIWARNFAESISSEYTAAGQSTRNAFISIDPTITDSLSARIRNMMGNDTAYRAGAEYAICIADGNGRILAMADHINGLDRPDPNDKPGFSKVIRGENGFVSQSLLRKKIGNINLLRLNPGPGSTLKPIIFSAIASQLYMDWDAFAAEGFSRPQNYYGGEKVAEYDFEKNNGRINNVVDYIRYSDNYYHSNLLLIGSYPKQPVQQLLSEHFASHSPTDKTGDPQLHWPYFRYKEKQYWLDGFKNWPGYRDGKSHFGMDSSYVSAGLFANFDISTRPGGKNRERFVSPYDSALFLGAYRQSGFILPESALFDQQGGGIDLRKPNEVFMACFRGHVKGSSQVMMPPVKMLDAFGKLVSQNRNYGLTLDPYAGEFRFTSFEMDNTVRYNQYLAIMRENVLEGMEQALFSGTAAKLGSLLKNGSPYFYYAKTGTTGDNEEKSKSKLFVLVISEKDITDPGFNFRDNRFYTIYFTSQNGPPKQNETFQKEIIDYIQGTPAFQRYMKRKP